MSDQAEDKCFQVKDLSPSIARVRIEQALKDIESGSLARFPTREEQNLIYVSGRVCMKSYNELKLSKITAKKARRMTAILKSLLHLNTEKKFLSKRGIFFKNKQLFRKQRISDLLIDDVCCMLAATHRCLRINASPRGLVIGSIVIRENGREINLQNFDVLGKVISPYMCDFDVVLCNAKFILVVENEVAYSSLIEDDFHKKVPCIMITGKGMPDMATLYFLRNLTKKLKNALPVLALVRCNPYGIKIMCAYTCGSDNLAFDSKNLVTPNIKWLGVRPTDLDLYDFASTNAELSPKEILIAKELKEKSFFMDKPSWVSEMDKMLKSKRKCKLDLVTSKNMLRKLAKKDWLPRIGDTRT